LLSAHNGESGGEASAEALNELASAVPLRARFDPEGEPHLISAAEAGDVVEEVTGRILAIVVLSAAEGTWRRLKARRNEGCLWAFYDRSKNRSGSWCTMDVCGSRAKMRAYRQRRSS
jgi:predicted RNA-binding Zn ribbon-like protein